MHRYELTNEERERITSFLPPLSLITRRFTEVELEGSNVLGDKAYGTESICHYIINENKNANYVIPPKINNPNPWGRDWRHY